MVDAEVAEGPAPSTSPRKPRRPRRRWRTLWILAPVLFLVLLGVARVVYWRTSIAYAPLRLVSGVAPAPARAANVRSTPSGILVSGPAGTEQTFEFQLKNHGKHPLDINAIQPADDAVAEVKWAANLVKHGRPGRGRSHHLPVYVRHDRTVHILLVVRKPLCPAGSVRYLSGEVTIHWHSMISPHTTTLNLLNGHPERIALCSTG